MLAESVQPDDAAAGISTSGLTNTGFTQNQERLREGVAGLHLQTLYAHVHGCPDITHYQADLIVNRNDPDALEAAIDDARHCSLGAELQIGRATPQMGPVPADTDSATMLAWPAARTEFAMGEQGVRVTEGIIQQLIAKLGTLPGQHSLILVSPGFFVGTSGAHSEEERILDKAAQANVTISSLDARGLYTFMLDSSQRYISLDKEKYNQQSLKANDAVIAELAAGTGGTYFYNSNDLAGGFKARTVAPECLYLLEFSPSDAKPDGTYHRLNVKVNLGGAKLQSRHGTLLTRRQKRKGNVFRGPLF